MSPIQVSDVNSSLITIHILVTILRTLLAMNLYNDCNFQIGNSIHCVKIIYDIFIYHVTFSQYCVSSFTYNFSLRAKMHFKIWVLRSPREPKKNHWYWALTSGVQYNILPIHNEIYNM